MTKESHDRDESIEQLLTGQLRYRDMLIGRLEREIGNFEDIARKLIPPPGSIPDLNGFDIYGESIPLNGAVGGDHIIYVDFNKRYDLKLRIEQAMEAGREDVAEQLHLNKKRAGILLVDASGHRITDAFLTGRLHDAFLTGVLYELDAHGEVTTRLFENLNTRFHNSSSVSKYLTLVYGEISETGKFRFILGGHPPPLVFSNEYDRLVEVGHDSLITFPPLGIMPSEEHVDRALHFSYLGYKGRYTVNEMRIMGRGDILLLYSDGLAEHSNGNEDYFPTRLERKLREVKYLPAKDIFASIKQDILAFARPADDVSYIVIKKN